MEPDLLAEERAGDGARDRDFDFEVCFEDSVYEDFGAFEVCEWTLPALWRRAGSSATKEDIKELGAVLRGLE